MRKRALIGYLLAALAPLPLLLIARALDWSDGTLYAVGAAVLAVVVLVAVPLATLDDERARRARAERAGNLDHHTA